MAGKITIGVLSFGLGFVICFLGLQRDSAPEVVSRRQSSNLVQSESTGVVSSALAVRGIEPKGGGGTNVPAFHWSSLESDDFHVYIRRLKAIGCPEQTIADIIRAEVNDLYAPRLAALSRPMNQYWSSTAELEEQKRKRAALEKEKHDFLYQELKIQKPVNVNVAIQGLSAEKQAHVQEAARLFPQVPLRPNSSPEEREGAAKNRADRLKYLAQFLTPEELQNYRIEHDGTAFAIHSALRGFDFSEREFRDVFEVLDGQVLHFQNGKLPPETERRLEATLGPERYAKYSETRTPENVSTWQFAQANRLPIETVRELIDLRKNLYGKNSDEYERAVQATIGNATTARIYLNNPIIHRPALEAGPRGVPPTQVLIDGRPE